ncbi:MAG: extracellular solute-binding protein [Lachnospiraceae bacterium]
MRKRLAGWIGGFAALAAVLAACGSGEKTAAGERSDPEFLTADVFDAQANYQGLQSGWYADVVRDRFNMELNLISPNVSGGGDTLYQTRSANGNLGDLILIRADRNYLSDMVRAGLVLDLTPYLSGEENLTRYRSAIESCSELAGQEGLWAVPSEISLLPADEPSESQEPTNGADLRFDLYEEIGAPKIATLEDLLPVLEKMQKAAGTSDSGEKVYAISLFRDWDDTIMQNAGAFAALYGYDPQGFAMLNVETGEKQSVLDSDGIYYRVLHFLYEANQEGLVDPDSASQGYDALAAKVRDGAVLYALWPWLGTGQYNSAEHMQAGKGFAVIGIDDAKYLCWGSFPEGKNSFAIMVGSKAQDPQRMVDFVDWLYSEEGVAMMSSDTGGTCGPEGLTWEKKDGEPVLTDLGKQVFVDHNTDVQVPESFGGGTWSEGVCTLNYRPLGNRDTMSDGTPYSFLLWKDYQEKAKTPFSERWEAWSGASTALEYIEKNDMVAVLPGTAWATPEDDSKIYAIRDQCTQLILDYSWRMVFAKNGITFNSLWRELQDACGSLGYDQVLQKDFADCDARTALYEKARGGADGT